MNSPAKSNIALTGEGTISVGKIEKMTIKKDDLRQTSNDSGNKKVNIEIGS